MVKRGLIALFAIATFTLLISPIASFAQQETSTLTTSTQTLTQPLSENSVTYTTTSSTHGTSLPEPTITITHIDSITGTHTETMPQNSQSSGTEYFRIASATFAISSSASAVLTPSFVIPSWLLQFILQILAILIANLIIHLTKGYLENRGNKPRPEPPGIVVGFPPITT